MGKILSIPKFGDKGDDVEDLQAALLNKGFNPGPIDGIYGGQTKKAFEAFVLAELHLEIEEPKDEPGPIHGIDMSHWQNEKYASRDLPLKDLFKAGDRFAFFKCTESTGYKDRYYDQNYQDAKEAGLITGAYHFFRANRSVGAQVEHFLKNLKYEKGVDLPPVLDLETWDDQGAETIKEKALEWLELVEARLGVRPIIYSYVGFLKALGDCEKLSKYPLWLAHYTSAKAPRMPKDWKNYTFWQYAESPHDVNWFNGSLSELRDFVRAAR